MDGNNEPHCISPSQNILPNLYHTPHAVCSMDNEDPPDEDPGGKKALADHLEKPETKKEIKKFLNEQQCRTQ